jgi:4a-hydroxytetrahydrobiopterin dehydratase
MEKLSQESVEAKLETLGEWRLNDGKLYLKRVFSDFVEAFEFMKKVAVLAESINHHPEWSNVYNRVEIYLTTHDADGITERDFDLAQKINQVLTDSASKR